jgi:hypothetical protein
MLLRSLVAFTVLGLSVAGAKSFDVNLPQTTKVGGAELKAGKYSVVVDGSKVRFKDAVTGKTTQADATVTTNDKKFALTQVDTTQSNGQNTIKEIDLGGTTTKLEFGANGSSSPAE